MNVSVTLDYVADCLKADPSRTWEERTRRAALLCKEHGITHFDYIVPRCADWAAAGERFRRFADSVGVAVNQCHAPMYRYRTSATRAEISESYLLAADVAAAMGASFLVVHGDEFRMAPGELFDGEKAVKDMTELLLPVAERAERNGVKLACENVFEEWPEKPRSRCCSRVEELLALIEGLNGTSAVRPENPVGCCWDFGHARCAFGEESPAALRRVVGHVVCTHVHDNLHYDDHLPPFLGLMDWPTLMDILKQQGYNGNLSMELHGGRVPEPLLPAFLTYLKQAGEMLVKMARPS